MELEAGEDEYSIQEDGSLLLTGGHRNRFQGTNSARQCSLAGRYGNPCSYSVPSPHRLFKNSSTGELFGWMYSTLRSYAQSDFVRLAIGFQQILCIVATCYWFLALLCFLKPETFIGGRGVHYNREPKFFLFLLTIIISKCSL
jgi:hypothetical protein